VRAVDSVRDCGVLVPLSDDPRALRLMMQVITTCLYSFIIVNIVADFVTHCNTDLKCIHSTVFSFEKKT
jgi:hypothetical protein